MEQISVRGVNFDNAESRQAGAARRRDEGFDNLPNPASSNAAGCGYPSAKGMALGATGVQPPLDSGTIPEPSQGRIVLPFSSCMRELNSGDRALFTNKTSDACERLDVLVLPDS